MVEQDVDAFDCYKKHHSKPCAELKSKITELHLLKDLLEQTLKIDLAQLELSQDSFFVEQFQKNQSYYQYIIRSTNSLLLRLENL